MTEIPPQQTPEWPEHHPIMDDLFTVGAEKPLGYLPLDTIIDYSGLTPEETARLCKANGLQTALFETRRSNIHSGALYVYASDSLQALVDDNLPLLRKYGWPTSPAELVDEIDRTTVNMSSQRDLYTLIAQAFADPRPEFQRTNPDSWTVPLSRETTAQATSRRLKRFGRSILRAY